MYRHGPCLGDNHGYMLIMEVLYETTPLVHLRGIGDDERAGDRSNVYLAGWAWT